MAEKISKGEALARVLEKTQLSEAHALELLDQRFPDEVVEVEVEGSRYPGPSRYTIVHEHDYTDEAVDAMIAGLTGRPYRQKPASREKPVTASSGRKVANANLAAFLAVHSNGQRTQLDARPPPWSTSALQFLIKTNGVRLGRMCRRCKAQPRPEA